MLATGPCPAELELGGKENRCEHELHAACCALSNKVLYLWSTRLITSYYLGVLSPILVSSHWGESLGATSPSLTAGFVRFFHGRDSHVIRRWKQAEALWLLAPAAVVTCSCECLQGVSGSSSHRERGPTAWGRPAWLLVGPDLWTPPSPLVSSRLSSDVVA